MNQFLQKSIDANEIGVYSKVSNSSHINCVHASLETIKQVSHIEYTESQRGISSYDLNKEGKDNNVGRWGYSALMLSNWGRKIFADDSPYIYNSQFGKDILK